MNYKLLYALTGLTALTFLLYWTIGYDTPYEDNPDQNAPLLTDAVLILAYLYAAGAVAVTAWSAIRSIRRNRSERVTNGVPATLISRSVAIGTAVLLVLTFALTPSTPLTINGQPYHTTFWLKASGMFVTTPAVLAIVAITATSLSRLSRRHDRNRKEARP